MTEMAAVAAIVSALDLPPRARVDARVPKKMLVEQGAPTTADKRAIQNGIDEMQWLAALKPNTIAIPAFSDEFHDYSEIAVIAAALRRDSRSARSHLRIRAFRSIPSNRAAALRFPPHCEIAAATTVASTTSSLSPTPEGRRMMALAMVSSPLATRTGAGVGAALADSTSSRTVT